jgi:DNA invertase Pin-like site-specific DNA recombinase
MSIADRRGLSMPPWKQRKIEEIITDLKTGDRILVSEMSRLGHSMMEIITILLGLE